MSLDRLAVLRGLQPARVCLIKPSSLGDVVHAFPVLAGLRDLWPEAHLAWVVNRGLRGLLDGHPDLDEVIPFDRSSAAALESRGDMASTARFLVDLRRRRGSTWLVDLQGLLRSGRDGPCHRRPGPGRPGSARARGRGTSLHPSGRLARAPRPTRSTGLLEGRPSAFGARSRPPRFRVAIGPDDATWATGGPGTRPRGRGWRSTSGPGGSPSDGPPGISRAVARRAVVERGAGLVLVGAPEDRPLVDEVKRSPRPDRRPSTSAAGRASRRLAAVASKVDVFLSNDTGTAPPRRGDRRAKVLGVYTCTSPARTGPYGPRMPARGRRVASGAPRAT